MTDERLEPCPFCGGEARVSGDKGGGFYVVCFAADCWAALGEQYDPCAMPDHAFCTPEEAAAAWNRRAPARPTITPAGDCGWQPTGRE